MQLDKLIVRKNGSLLREIKFKAGLNLIINAAGEKSGNSVGKSTASRLIDYLFLSSGDDIYKEPEFDKKIPDVANFIEQNSILVELEFTSYDNIRHLIARELKTTPRDALFYINGETVTNSEYSQFIANKIFGLTTDNISLRNLSHKFIRNTNDKMQKTTRFLHLNTKADQYDQLYLFLFGFSGINLLKEKHELNKVIAKKRKHLAAYRNPHKESALEKMLTPLKADEIKIKEKIASYDFTDNQETSVKELVKVQEQISSLTIKYSNIESKVSYYNKSIDNIRKNITSIDGRELFELYTQAGAALSEGVKKSYEELKLFHNKILSNKFNLIENELLRCKTSANEIKSLINELQEKESSIFKHIKEPDTLKSIGAMYNDLSLTREKIASITTLLEQIVDTKKSIDKLESSKQQIIKTIDSQTDQLDKNIEIFNRNFSELSKEFYNEQYIFDLTFDVEKEKCEFNIACVSPNSTGGKKKGELTAFDFAYIEFVNEKKFKRPTFVIHDSIEDVDSNQILDIFKTANKIGGQYIVAMLSDKISASEFSEFTNNDVILKLSESDKFFKI